MGNLGKDREASDIDQYRLTVLRTIERQDVA